MYIENLLKLIAKKGMKYITLILLMSSWSCELYVADQKKPNFIIIFCDNLGYGDIEPFGSTLHRTPNLHRMAKEGRKFTHFYVTAGVCTPSRSSIMTGCYSQRVGMHVTPSDGWVLRPVSPYGLNPDEVTVADVLKGKDSSGESHGLFSCERMVLQMFAAGYGCGDRRQWKEDTVLGNLLIGRSPASAEGE